MQMQMRRTKEVEMAAAMKGNGKCAGSLLKISRRPPFSFHRLRRVVRATPTCRIPSFKRLQISCCNCHGVPAAATEASLLSEVEKGGVETEETEVTCEFNAVGVGEEEMPVKMQQTRTLSPSLTLSEALDKLRCAVNDLKCCPPECQSGIIRFQVALPQDIKALDWLRCQTKSCRTFPCGYFSPKGYDCCPLNRSTDVLLSQPGKVNQVIFKAVAGVGSAVLFKGSNTFSFKDWRAVKRFLPVDSPFVRAYGCISFNSGTSQLSQESEFGSFYIFIPQIEMDEADECSILAATVAWDDNLLWPFQMSLNKLDILLHEISPYLKHSGSKYNLTCIQKDNIPDKSSWKSFTNAFFGKETLGRTQIVTDVKIDLLELLAVLQEKERDEFQFYIQPRTAITFMGCSSHNLFRRKDLLIAIDMFTGVCSQQCPADTQNGKLQTNFSYSNIKHECDIIMQEVKGKMKQVCRGEVTELIFQNSNVRLTGELKTDNDEFDLLSSLHPSPVIHADAGQEALYLSGGSLNQEMYGRPVGWFGCKDSEFFLATGSAFMQHGKALQIFMDSELQLGNNISSSSQKEVELRTRKYESLLASNIDLQSFRNINSLWAYLIVEECCRLGITYFCIAPGSRSSALAAAAGKNPLVTCISGIDERSLAFHALGYAKGSNKPAAVITSSGTAVSNLLPAVVEASQDCIPLLLLTADRPPELHDAGANQAVNQVNHFGSFVRYFFNLPPPDDKIPAKMVLTTIDYALHIATQEPLGPVHINCGFREPLAGSSCKWLSTCLKGLSRWYLRKEPYTKYIKQNVTSGNVCDQYIEVIDIIHSSRKGLLVAGGLKTFEDSWAIVALAQHLGWPVFADALSGLRFRKVNNTNFELASGVCFVDMLDHVLLSDLASDWISPDVIIQVGGRLTSKRVHKLLEHCRPVAYILIEIHPCRHDPSHILTHRIQDSALGFTTIVRRLCMPKENSGWCKFLKFLNNMVNWEVSFQLNAETALTEPYASRAITSSLSSGTAFFIGNSMPLRDADMYGIGWSISLNTFRTRCTGLVPFSVIKVSGNRGASGIDGLISTAIGFSVGTNQRVIFSVGDISFLHDANGLGLLNEKMNRPPMTILVMNNHGGSIFSLLPVSQTTPPAVFQKLFTTPHNVSLKNLCSAYSVEHIIVHTKQELAAALHTSQSREADCVIEINSEIEDNAAFHRFLQRSVREAVNHVFSMTSSFIPSEDLNFHQLSVLKIEYLPYRIPFILPPTTNNKDEPCAIYREGFLLVLYLKNGTKGYGEVAPIGMERESLLDVEEQLRFLVQRAKTKTMLLDDLLSMLNDSFQRWVWERLNVPASSLLPSVRCGLEMAVLTALAATRHRSISELLLGIRKTEKVLPDQADKRYNSRIATTKVQVCALLDIDSTPDIAAELAEKLVKEGFRTIKLKVARRSDPMEDVAVVRAVRHRVGSLIDLRADANRKWSFDQAIRFAVGVKDNNLQYIEEPVEHSSDLLRFCDESGLFVALDETIDELADQSLDKLQFDKLSMFVHPRIVATVIKPSRVGGFERAALIAKWAHKHGMMAIISSAFESSVGLSAYAQFAHYINCRKKEAVRLSKSEQTQVQSHGLGTYKWLRDDVVSRQLPFKNYAEGAGIEVDINNAAAILQNVELNPETVKIIRCQTNFTSYTMTVQHTEVDISFNVLDSGKQCVKKEATTLVFLHGYLGGSQDWIPIMQALSLTARCIAIDLPGHGKTQVLKRTDFTEDYKYHTKENLIDINFSIEVIAGVLSELVSRLADQKVILVGYSMGARIALYMSLRIKLAAACVLISGSPGIKDPHLRMIRASQDVSLAESLLASDLKSFVTSWYEKNMWESLRSNPVFEELKHSRTMHNSIPDLAKATASLSVGRQPSLWADLKCCKIPLFLIVGDQDTKFKDIAQKMCCCQEGKSKSETKIEMLVAGDADHAVHIENPLLVIHAIRNFLIRIRISLKEHDYWSS